MTNRQNLIDRIVSGEFMTREDQVSEFNQYQERGSYDYEQGCYPDTPQMPETLHIFYSFYSYEDYSGYGYIWGYDEAKDVFIYNSGSHCSCYGLEGQWDVEEYTYEELIAFVQRQVDQTDRSSYSFDERELTERVELLKTIVGEV